MTFRNSYASIGFGLLFFELFGQRLFRLVLSLLWNRSKQFGKIAISKRLDLAPNLVQGLH